MSAARAAQAWEWHATGTTWRIHHDGGLPAEAARGAAWAVEQAEATLSRFRPTSDVARLSRAAGRHVAVAALTLDVLEAAEALREETSGAFDVLVGGAVVAAGYAATIERVGTHALRSVARPIVQRAPIELDRARGTARLPRGSRLDLGAIGKGAIAARVGAALVGACDGPILLDAGGDLVAVQGDHRIAVEDAIASVRLAPGDAVATSSARRRRWRCADGTVAHHLIDPALGAPAAAPVQATVVSPDAVRADALATACAIRPRLADALAEPVLLVEPGGDLRTNEAWRRAAA